MATQLQVYGQAYQVSKSAHPDEAYVFPLPLLESGPAKLTRLKTYSTTDTNHKVITAKNTRMIKIKRMAKHKLPSGH